MAVRLMSLCSVVLFFAGPASVEAVRSVHHHGSTGTELGGAATSSGDECNFMVATINFPTIHIQFSILEKGARGDSHQVTCGSTAANPDDTVTFVCTDYEEGLGWKYESGDCRSEAPLPGSSVVCPAVQFEANWKVGERDVPMTFAMQETPNPEGEDLPVEVKCPEHTPGAGRTFTFTCTKSGQWDFDGGKKTLMCASDGDDLEQGQGTPEEPSAAHEVITGALPCTLDTADTDLKGGGKGFSLRILCEKTISGGVIQVDGVDQWTFGLTDYSKPSSIVTLSDAYYGRELTIRATAEGSVGTVSIKPRPEPPLITLPCELTTRPAQLTSGAGFQVVVNCKTPITKGVLILPGFQDKPLKDPLNGVEVVYTQSVSAFKDKTLAVQGFSGGAKGVTNGVTI